jgi:metal-sulfur cluster biosynthetic enzyme
MAQRVTKITAETLTNSLCICADWIKEHASELVGQIDYVSGLTVAIQFDPGCVPTVTVNKEYVQPKAVAIDEADYVGREI